jgi:hypothetical protein
MRCKNCGWDNAGGGSNCEKCNAPLSGYMATPQPQAGYGADDYSPRATVVGGFAPKDEFNPQATTFGCVACGYPIRPADAACPMCGQQVPGGAKQAPAVEKPVAEEPKPEKKETFAKKGTIIQSTNLDKEQTDKDRERKKLTGFLVSYSLSPNGEFFPLYEGKNIIGRAETANVSIQNDSAISDRHVSILNRTVDRKFKFKDEQSSNGTFINEELLDDGELKNLDIIRVGNTRLLFMEIPSFDSE